MRLIDADALKTIRSIQSADYNSIETIQHWIDNAPTIDAVPVVRCKDCKWKADAIGESWCDFHEFTILLLSDDDYCSHGERRRR